MSGGYTQWLTIIDRSSRWPEAVPISSTTAAACVSAFFRHWVSRFGVPAVITSDRGVQFTASLWSSMCQLFAMDGLPTVQLFYPLLLVYLLAHLTLEPRQLLPKVCPSPPPPLRTAGPSACAALRTVFQFLPSVQKLWGRYSDEASKCHLCT
jgi:hypothetical protein